MALCAADTSGEPAAPCGASGAWPAPREVNAARCAQGCSGARELPLQLLDLGLLRKERLLQLELVELCFLTLDRGLKVSARLRTCPMVVVLREARVGQWHAALVQRGSRRRLRVNLGRDLWEERLGPSREVGLQGAGLFQETDVGQLKQAQR